MFFQVHAWIFAQLIFFQGPLSIFVSVTFTEVLMKDLTRMLIHVRKNYSCNQVIFRMPLSKKITITVTEVVLFQLSFLTVGSKQK